MDSKIAIIAGVVVVALVAAGAGGFLLLNGNDDKEATVTEMAQGFTYDGAFGAFKFSDKSTEELGSVIMPIEGSGMLSHSQIDWKKSDDAKADYDAIVAKIKEKGTFAGTSPVVLSVDNENMYVVEYNMNMPTSKFTLVYFAAYNGKTVIECYSNPLYHPSGLASDADISEILSTVMKTVGAEAVTVTTPADALATLGTKAYKGVYGTLTVKEGATADTASMFKTNASERLATSAITFKNTADAKTKYEAAAAEILAKPAMMGAQPMALSITGADYTAVQFNVKMGMSTFSLVYIAGYSGNVFIDGYSEAMYLTSFATVNDVAELINTAQFVLGGDNVNVALAPATSASGFITAYSGALEGFAAADSNNATAAKVSKENDSERLATTSIEWKVVEDGKAYYEKVSKEILEKGNLMGATPKTYAVEGGDMTIVQYDVSMGPTTKFSLIYFVGYSGNNTVESVKEALYYSGGFAEAEEVENIIKLSGAGIGLGAVTLTLP